MASTRDFLPTREGELVPWLRQFAQKVSLAPTTYGATIGQATSLQNAVDAFIESWDKAQSNDTRTPSIIQLKSTNKDLAIVVARQVAGVIQKFPGTTDEMRVDLGLTVKAAPQPAQIPPRAPVLEVLERFGTTVRVKLHDGPTSRRGRPDFAEGAAVFSLVAPEASPNPAAYKLEGLTPKMIFDVTFPAETPAGTVVYLTAHWFNSLMQSGIGCQPVKAIIAGGAISKTA